jgi:hypothetical protein
MKACYSFVVSEKIWDWNSFFLDRWAVFHWHCVPFGKPGFQFCFKIISCQSSYVIHQWTIQNLVTKFATSEARHRDQSPLPVCINVHRYKMIWSWSDMCLGWKGTRDGLWSESEWIRKGSSGAVRSSEGFIQGLVLIYVLGSFIPCSQNDIRGSSICYCCDCILYLWV